MNKELQMTEAVSAIVPVIDELINKEPTSSCRKCHETLPISQFGFNKSGKPYKACADCRAKARAYDTQRRANIIRQKKGKMCTDTGALKLESERVLADLSDLLTKLIVRHERTTD